MRRTRRAALKLMAAGAGMALGGRSLSRRPALAAARIQIGPYLADHRIVSYYGTPLAAGLGVLGQGPPTEMIARLRAQADAYAALDAERTTVGALHLIYAVAQAAAGADGLYLSRAPDELVAGLSALARENDMLLVLDNQVGRSTIARELSIMIPFLAEPHVHLALDPEFAWGPGVTPVSDIGHLAAAQVNEVQVTLQGIARENNLSGKLLIVHQFRHGMLPDKAAIGEFEGVELVIDMDGFGPPASKLATYDAVITRDGVRYPGIKLFYDHDVPLLSPADVLALEPRPVVVIYQ